MYFRNLTAKQAKVVRAVRVVGAVRVVRVVRVDFWMAKKVCLLVSILWCTIVICDGPYSPAPSLQFK